MKEGNKMNHKEEINYNLDFGKLEPIDDHTKEIAKEELLQLFEEKLRQMLNSRKITAEQTKEFKELKLKILNRMHY